VPGIFFCLFQGGGGVNFPPRLGGMCAISGYILPPFGTRPSGMFDGP